MNWWLDLKKQIQPQLMKSIIGQALLGQTIRIITWYLQEMAEFGPQEL
jgi:hypothetical protein